jgi:predicted metal-dependent peptidase
MNAKTKISKAVIKLFSYPFWGSFITNFEIKENRDAITTAINNKFEILYNPKFIEKLDDFEVVGALLHELGHYLFVNHKRQSDRDSLIWNIACDIVINYQLIQSGISLPKKGLIPEGDKIDVWGITIKNIDKKSAEDIYDELIKNSKILTIKQSFINLHGECIKIEGFTSKEDEEAFDRKLKDAIIKAKISVERNNQWGKLPVGLQRIIEEYTKTEINWKYLLSKYVQQLIPYDLTWSRPNKKLLEYGYFPSIKKENLEVVVAVDTSGSIDEELLNKFFSHLKAILSSFANIVVHYLCFDADVQDYKKLRNLNDLKAVEPKGGGGTNIQSAFDFAKKKKINPNVFIVLTDGYGDFKTEYNFRTIWVFPKDDYNQELNIKGRQILIK